MKNRKREEGIIYGLVVMGQGEGGILSDEMTALPGTGYTGSLGDVYALSFRFQYRTMFTILPPF